MADERIQGPQSLIEVWQTQEIEPFNPEMLPKGIIRILGQRIEDSWQGNYSIYKIIPDDKFDQPICKGFSPLTDLRFEVSDLFSRISVLSNGQTKVPPRRDVSNLTKNDLLDLYGKATRKLINLFTQKEKEENIADHIFLSFSKETSGLELLTRAYEHIINHTGTLLKYVVKYGRVTTFFHNA